MAGEYRPILTEQFKKDGFTELSELIANKSIMIAITDSIQGNVTTRKDLKETFITALERADKPHSSKYVNGLSSGAMVPVESFDGKTYIAEKNYSSGELYFTT